MTDLDEREALVLRAATHSTPGPRPRCEGDDSRAARRGAAACPRVEADEVEGARCSEALAEAKFSRARDALFE